jgi:hypothetical protein
MASFFARVAGRDRQGRRLHGVPGSERGSMAFGVAVVALTSRSHSHYVTGKGSITSLIIFVVVVVILFGVNWFRRNRRN